MNPSIDVAVEIVSRINRVMAAVRLYGRGTTALG